MYLIYMETKDKPKSKTVRLSDCIKIYQGAKPIIVNFYDI